MRIFVLCENADKIWVLSTSDFHHRAAMTREHARAKRIFFCAATPGAAAFTV
jgi:hypothetical protein